MLRVMRSGERGGGGLTKKGRLTINNTGGHSRSGAGGDELNTKSNRDRLGLKEAWLDLVASGANLPFELADREGRFDDMMQMLGGGEGADENAKL